MLDDDLLSRRLDWDAARALEGESFELIAADGAPPVRLTVRRARIVSEAPHMRQFALDWRGPPAPVLEQRIYRVRHARLGDYAVFLTPLGRDAQGVDYESCFAHAP